MIALHTPMLHCSGKVKCAVHRSMVKSIAGNILAFMTQHSVPGRLAEDIAIEREARGYGLLPLPEYMGGL